MALSLLFIVKVSSYTNHTLFIFCLSHFPIIRRSFHTFVSVISSNNILKSDSAFWTLDTHIPLSTQDSKANLIGPILESVFSTIRFILLHVSRIVSDLQI